MDIQVKKAEHINNYKIKLFFSDGKESIIDFEAFLKRAKNPMTKKYLDVAQFEKFKITYGDLEWNDYEMCFPIWNLYTNKNIH